MDDIAWISKRYVAVVVVVLGASSCTRRNPAYCESDSDCPDPTRPFCDLNGEYAESNYAPNTCSVVPVNCPLQRCPCTPGATLGCSGDQLSLCASDGHSASNTHCALGCTVDGKQCKTFAPSNGLGDALADAAGEPDMVVPPGARIDTDLGVIQTSSGVSLPVKTTIVQQPGQPSIRVFEAKSFTFDDATVTGANALALVAPGVISIRGHFDLSAKNATPGPGAQEPPAVCSGSPAVEFTCSGGLNLIQSNGGGGAGNATAGGTGGAVNASSAGGALVPTYVPLVGGCRGGRVDLYLQGTLLAQGGGGGGALQLVSLDTVDIRGLVELGGGGGAATQESAGGGGSGGLLVIESPTVIIEGPGGVVANGGSGGGCDTPGSNGGPTSAAASTVACSNAGAGGTGSLAPTNAYSCLNTQTVTCVCSGYFAGGGGAAGRLHVVSLSGAATLMFSPIVSAQVTGAVLESM